MSRTRHSTINYLTNVTFTVVTLALALVATPFMLRWLGAEALGAYRAAADWVGYLAVLELGLGGAMLPLVARALSQPDGDGGARLRAVMTGGFRAYRWVTVPMLCGAAGLVAIMPWLMPGASPALARDVRVAVALAGLTLVFVPLSPLRALWEARQRGYVVGMILIGQSVLITAAALWFARRGWGVTGQMLALLTGAVAFHAALLTLTARAAPDALRWLFAPDRSPDARLADAELWRLNWPTLMLNVAGRVSYLTDNIVIAYLLGPAAVVPFFLTQRLAQLAQGQVQSVGNATWAGLAELHHSGQRPLLVRRFLELNRLVALLGLAALVPIVAFNRRFVELWVGPASFAGNAVTVLAGVNAIMLSLASLWGWLFSGTGQVRLVARPSLVAAAINVLVSALATLQLGVVGPLVGTKVARACVPGWYVPLLMRRHFGIEPTMLLRAVGLPVLLAVPCAAGAWLLARQPAAAALGWAGLLGAMGACGLAYLGLAWVLLLNRDEQLLWARRMRGLAGAPAEVAR